MLNNTPTANGILTRRLATAFPTGGPVALANLSVSVLATAFRGRGFRCLHRQHPDHSYTCHINWGRSLRAPSHWKHAIESKMRTKRHLTLSRLLWLSATLTSGDFRPAQKLSCMLRYLCHHVRCSESAFHAARPESAWTLDDTKWTSFHAMTNCRSTTTINFNITDTMAGWRFSTRKSAARSCRQNY